MAQRLPTRRRRRQPMGVWFPHRSWLTCRRVPCALGQPVASLACHVKCEIHARLWGGGNCPLTSGGDVWCSSHWLRAMIPCAHMEACLQTRALMGRPLGQGQAGGKQKSLGQSKSAAQDRNTSGDLIAAVCRDGDAVLAAIAQPLTGGDNIRRCRSQEGPRDESGGNAERQTCAGRGREV